MKFKAIETVYGISNMEWDINGEKVLGLAVHMQTVLDPKQGGKGFRSEPVKVADRDVIQAIAHNSFPAQFEVEVEMQAGQKQGSVRQVIVGIRPVTPQKS